MQFNKDFSISTHFPNVFMIFDATMIAAVGTWAYHHWSRPLVHCLKHLSSVFSNLSKLSNAANFQLAGVVHTREGARETMHISFSQRSTDYL